MNPLPFAAAIPELLAAVQRGNAVLVAPPGVGKTTRAPPALVDAGFRRVIVLEPRRVAARAAARRIASERGWTLGREVGFQIRFERVARDDTPLLFVTEGLLVRMLQDDPFLEGTAAVVFDEIHERSVHTDLALAMTRRVQRDARPDLRIVAMSATLDPGPIADFLDAPVIRSESVAHPVSVEHGAGLLAAVRRALDRSPGDVLVFLAGIGDIRRAVEDLAGLAARRDTALVPLYGDLAGEQQDAALRRGSRRKIVLATNVAESSVTVDGVTAVVDGGTAKVLRHDPASGMDRLEEVRISKASADQRAGRAGRQGPGLAIRLWAAHERLREREEPELRRVDLAGPALQLRAWGEADLATFPWFEAPDPARLAVADALLVALGAVEGGRVTALGQRLAKLPVHPRLGRLLLEAWRLGQPDAGALAAAVLSERDVFAGQDRATRSDSDVLDRVHAVEGGRGGAVRRAAGQLLRSLPPAPRATADPEEAVLRALLAAFPDRVARRREVGSGRARMVGGRGVRLDERSAVRDAELFVCVDVDDRGTEATVRVASAVERAWLPLETRVEGGFDGERVVAVRRVRYRDLVIEEAPAPPPPDASRLLAEAARSAPEKIVPSEETAELLARMALLAAAMPELGLPDVDLGAVIDALAEGRRSLAELRRAPWRDAILGLLTYKQREALDREAPERLEVPSGSRARVTYEAGRPPVLAVKLQELFGLADTPRIAGGRIPVLLHLLSPSGRPVQVTQDLRSFWDTTYKEVKKELAGRYPKHPWPDDPWTARATRFTKKRGG